MEKEVTMDMEDRGIIWEIGRKSKNKKE